MPDADKDMRHLKAGCLADNGSGIAVIEIGVVPGGFEMVSGALVPKEVAFVDLGCIEASPEKN
jgi:hypothetical protein